MRTKTRQMLSLGNKIKEARENVGLTQDQLAERIGVSRAAVARYEAGEIEPRLKNLIALSECLNVSTDFLLDVKTLDNDSFQLSKQGVESLEVLLHELTLFQQRQKKEGKNQA